MISTPNNTIALIFLYELSKLPDLERLCDNTKNFDIDLVVGSHNKNHAGLQQFCDKFYHRILNLQFHDNYGVDIAPFIERVVSIDKNKYPYFIKLHAKSSLLGQYKHVDWGSILWDSLIGNQKSFNHNKHILSQSHIGAITQPFLIFDNRELNNTSKIKTLCNIFNIEYNKISNDQFMAGSIFMSKTDLFQKVLLEHKNYLNSLLSGETGKVDDRDFIDGTYCHALERVFGYMIKYQKFKIHSTSLYPVIKIYNKTHKILHLHITYQNMVYLVEDFNICGSIQYKDNKYIIIEWYHLNNKKIIYEYLNNKTITKVS